MLRYISFRSMFVASPFKVVFAAMRCAPFLLTAILFAAGAFEVLSQNDPGRIRECPRNLVFGSAGFDEVVGQLRGGGDTDHDPTAIRVDTDLVVAEFDVRDKKGKRIAGLGAADFRLEEDGVEHSIEVFSFGRASARISRSIILLIDYSQSQIPYLETSVEAAKVLVDLLEPNDRMAIVTDDVELLVNFTSDKSVLKEHLESLKTKALSGKYGQSRQLSSLYAAVGELFAANEKRPVVIMQTDGDEFAPLSAGLTRPGKDGCLPIVKKFEELESLLERSGTTVYSIIPGVRLDQSSESERIEAARFDLEMIIRREAEYRKLEQPKTRKPFADRVLKNWARSRMRNAVAVEQIARLTGGIPQYLEAPDRAEGVYRRILDEMNQRYLIGYYPQRTVRDGRRRTIKIELRKMSDYSVIGRTSYTPAN